MSRGRWIGALGALALGALALALWIYGADFYTTHPWDRQRHPSYHLLRSAGTWGHALGIVGTALILANLTFLLRRRVRSFRRFGPLRRWMTMHVLTGIAGPLLVVYHTAFYPRTDVAITALVSLGVLVVTGIIGRFIYAMVPHTVAGAELGRAELEARLEEARAHLAERTGGDDDPLWQKIQRLSQPPRAVPKSSLACLAHLPYSVAATAWLRGRLRRLQRRRPEIDWRELRDYALIRRRLQTVKLYRGLLRWWRGIHRWVAALMVVAMVVHVVVALYFGYLPGDNGL